ncbi:hypothetical protein GCM10017673_33390 [Streptosporangium violaceochromogenes]|nr:hypothetical protein GCM10017673_33390 [Streptosporangium violaceochromogenes]
MVKIQPIGSWCGGAGLRACDVPLGRAPGAFLRGAARAPEDPARPEAPLAGDLPEAPLDVRVAMLVRLTRRRADGAEARRKTAGRGSGRGRGTAAEAGPAAVLSGPAAGRARSRKAPGVRPR